MNVYWNDQLLQRCPIIGTAAEPPAPQPQPQPCPLDPTCDPYNVILSGPGLTNARVREEAEFIMDGSKAGPGSFRLHFAIVYCLVGSFRTLWVESHLDAPSLIGSRNLSNHLLKFSPVPDIQPKKRYGVNFDLHRTLRVNLARLEYTFITKNSFFVN